MKPGRILSCLFAATLAGAAPAQTPPPVPHTGGPRIAPAKRTDQATKPRKAVIPDPDLLDGSTLEAEKHPLYGMLSEIEMGEKEGGKSARISPESGPEGGGEEKEKGGGAKDPAAQPPESQGKDPKIPEGPEAPAEGIKAADLKVPEGASSGGAEKNSGKPRDLQIGDATLQIQTQAKNAPNIVGVDSGTSQQYEKKVPGGAPPSGDNRNRGVEKGRVVPKGL